MGENLLVRALNQNFIEHIFVSISFQCSSMVVYYIFKELRVKCQT